MSVGRLSRGQVHNGASQATGEIGGEEHRRARQFCKCRATLRVRPGLKKFWTSVAEMLSALAWMA